MAYDKVVDSSILDGYFDDIADAIRYKNGSQNTYTPTQMPGAITNLPTSDSIAEIYSPPYASSYINNNIQIIGKYMFAYSYLKSVSLNNAKNIYENAFYFSTIEQINFPNVETINANAFAYCKDVNAINLPKLDTIAGYAFSLVGDNLSSPIDEVTLPALTILGNYSCQSLNCSKLNVPSMTDLGSGSLQQSALQEFTVPATCTYMGSYVFGGLNRLTKITFENDITKIPLTFIYGCSNLSEISFLNCTSVPTLAGNYLQIPNTCIIKVPAALETQWKQATNWVALASQIVGE